MLYKRTNPGSRAGFAVLAVFTAGTILPSSVSAQCSGQYCSHQKQGQPRVAPVYIPSAPQQTYQPQQQTYQPQQQQTYQPQQQTYQPQTYQPQTYQPQQQQTYQPQQQQYYTSSACVTQFGACQAVQQIGTSCGCYDALGNYYNGVAQ
jgi:hypothetical protein